MSLRWWHHTGIHSIHLPVLQQKRWIITCCIIQPKLHESREVSILGKPSHATRATKYASQRKTLQRRQREVRDARLHESKGAKVVTRMPTGAKQHYAAAADGDALGTPLLKSNVLYSNWCRWPMKPPARPRLLVKIRFEAPSGASS